MTQFEIIWRDRFGLVPPVGYRLRDSSRGSWIRFHASPKSKRYAEHDEERSVILSRANILASELFEHHQPFWLVSSRVDENLTDINFEPKKYVIRSRELPKLFNWSDLTEAPEDRIRWATYSKLFCWSANAFDDVFLKIANDEDYGIIFATPDMSSILAPYDGGFDVISTDTNLVETLRKKYPSWLSEREDGL